MKTGNFDINKIPVATAELGEFPFFSLLKNIQEQNKPIKRSYDKIYFPIDGKMTPLEGKVWKSYIVKQEDSDENWSLPYFLKSYDDAITVVGGVKIFDDKVSQEEMDRIDEDATYFGEEGSIDYWNEKVRTYVIHRKNGDDVYIQISGNSASGQLQILQKAPFVQTITMLKSDQIQKDLSEKGKSILHINFDTDKATLQSEGMTAVSEIVKALNADKSLKIAINGYTDNSGDAQNNLQLSKKRAESVKNELIKNGIDASRLTSDGFGQNNPVADNGSDTGKAENRRVELIKK